MADISPITQQPFTHDGDTDANDPRSQADPFYQSTPRTSPSGLTNLIAAMQLQQTVPHPPARHSRQPAPRTKIPACTHTAMARVYGPNVCHNCGKEPSMGWLYTCRQDFAPHAHHLLPSDSADALPTVSDSANYLEAQAQTAASLGMSASVVKQMAAGTYAYDQIETLLAQRRHVIDTIRRTKDPSSASVPPTPESATQKKTSPKKPRKLDPVIGQNLNMDALPVPSAETPYNTPTDLRAGLPRPTTLPTTLAEFDDLPQSLPKKPVKKETCTYQVCHTCRPFFQDRLAPKLDPMLKDERPVHVQLKAMILPIQDAAVVSNLGLRVPPPPAPLHRSDDGMDITMHRRECNGYESFGQDTSSDWTPTTTSSSEGESEAYDPNVCPGPGLCPVWDPTTGCAHENGLDDGRRELNHGRSQPAPAHGLGISKPWQQIEETTASITSTPENTPPKGSSISLPNMQSTPGTEITLSTPRSSSLPDRSSPRSNKSSHSNSSGSEVEVEGGVALTEEAVETGTPDIAVD